MWAVWVKSLLAQALKSYPKGNKLPNLVTLSTTSNDVNLLSNGPPHLSICHQRAVHKRKIS